MKERLTFEREIELQTGSPAARAIAAGIEGRYSEGGPEFLYELPALSSPPAARPGGGASSCARRSATNQSQRLKEPFARPCCVLLPRIPIVGDQSLSPDDAAPHFYGENRYPADEKNGYVYTCHGGFIDLGHSRDWLDWTGYLAVHAKAALPAGGELELTCDNGSTRTVQFKAQRGRRSDELCVHLAQRIAYELAVWHELATGLLRQRYSAFSPEDNYSNLVGTYMGRDALFKFGKKPFNEAAALAIRHWLNRLGAVTKSQTAAAFAAVRNVWWQDGPGVGLDDVVLKRHFDALGKVVPLLVPGACPGKKALPLAVPTIVQTSQGPGVMVKTDLRKLYELKLGVTPAMSSNLAGTRWDSASHVTSADFADLITHVKTLL